MMTWLLIRALRVAPTRPPQNKPRSSFPGRYFSGLQAQRTLYINRWKELKQIPAKTKESDLMCKELKRRGFKFVGSTICYAHMLAAGTVSDHVISCFRYDELLKMIDKPQTARLK